MPKVVSVGGLPVANPVDTWVHLAATLTVPELVIVGDHLVRKKRPLATLAELHAGVASQAGRRNVTRLREALALIRPHTGSPKETELRLLIRDAGLPEPLVGFEVHDHGYFVGTPDLAYPTERIAIEYEGDVHRVDLETFRDDIDRRERFEDAGWRVIRVTADQLLRPAALVERISFALAIRAQPRSEPAAPRLPSKA
jgi:very-short-patch-repair endonuclease